MRRLWSYLILSLTTLILVGVNFLSVIGGLNTNLEFTSGREMVFRIADKENEDFVFADNEAVSDIAATMINRLENALVTKYEVNVEGNDQIRVTVSETSETKYTRLQTYLGFDAEFTLCTTTEVCATNEQMFANQSARIEYRGQNPFVVFGVDDLTYLNEVLITEAGGEASTDGELLLWAGKVEADSYSESLNNPDMAKKILLRLPIANLWWDTDNKTELAYLVSPSKFGQPNQNNIFAPNVVSQANEEAIYYRNLFNATDLPYDVEFLYSQNIPAAIEPLISLTTILSLENSQTLWAMVSAIVMMVVVLIVVYRLGALGMLATTTLSIFATLFAFVSLRLEFSTSALLGIITVGVLGVLTSVLYLTYVRREIYQGRSLKKAHIEANGQLFPLMLDITVIGLIFGLFVYIFGGNLSQSFAVTLMLGSVANIFFVFFGNQLMYGQLLQASILPSRLDLISINPRLIPDLVKDEKPVYFGRFATRDFASKGPLLTPIAVIVGILSLAAIITLTAINVPVINPPANTTAARLYLEAKEFSRFESTANIQEDLIANLFVNDEPLTLSNDTIQVHEFTRIENEISVLYRIFVAELAIETREEVTFSFDDGINDPINNANFNDLLEEVITLVYEDDDQVTVVGFYPTVALTNQPTVLSITLGTLIAIAIVGIYLMIRQGLAKALATMLISGVVALFTIGLFIASRIPSPATLALSLLTLSYFNILAVVTILNRAKALQRTIVDRPVTMDDFTLSLKKASSQIAGPIFLTVLALVYPGLTFLALGPGALQGVFAALLLGSALIALFTTAIIPAIFKPLYIFLKTFTQSLSFDWLPRRRANAKVEVPVRSNEPQEATYIGIND